MHSLSNALAWLLANKDAVLVAVAGIVTTASLLIKALETLVAILVSLFPGLQGLNGELLAVAAWLDGLAKSRLLNAVALSPKAAKALVAVLALGLALHSAPARAQVLVSSGPTLPLMEVRPGNPHPIQLAPGAGYQLSLTLPQFQRAIMGKAWDLLDVNLMAFGTAVSSSSGATFGALSAAVGLCTLSSLLCLGGGHDVATAGGAKPGWFGLFAFSFNIDTAPSAPPAGVKEGAQGLVRGNTLFLGI